MAALLVVDLQNEFLSPTGNFPIHNDSRPFLERVQTLVPNIRPRCPVFWIRSEYTPTVEFRQGTHNGTTPCCAPDTTGADIPGDIEDLVHPLDEIITKNWYSAFKDTNLEDKLRSAGVTQLFICGLISYICVAETVRDAQKAGFDVVLIKDCLGWRNEGLHTKVVTEMAESGVILVESDGVLQRLIQTSTSDIRPPRPQHTLATDSGKKLKNLGPEDVMGEGDTSLVLHLLPKELAISAFEKLKDEVAWEVMHHRGGEVPRLVAVQGQIEPDGSFPVYRHPADESPPLRPFTPTVSLIRTYVEQALHHPVNHVLIQLYRNSNDYISEHSDKTIDVVHGSKIVNVSLGAERLMILRSKKDALGLTPTTCNGEGTQNKRTAQRIPLPHNSMFVLGLETNTKWLHGIRQDKRFIMEKTLEETAFDGARISLTFRRIGTFLSPDEKLIYGQGATGKTKEEAKAVINGDEKEAEKLIIAFGHENQRGDFDWEAEYGQGFDILHFKTSL